jgi:hypothetical protein
MADRIDPEVPQQAVHSSNAAASKETEHPFIAEISAPMLDVPAPHQSVHTWRDFFIHIATISVGLLIAIGLEQTVEAIHHARERRELIANMRDEARQNLKSAQEAYDAYSARAAWLRESVDVVRRATSSNGIFDLTLPAAAPFPGNAAPLLPAWSVAKTNGNAALLPEERAEVYERLSREANMLENAKDRLRKADLDLTATGLRLGTVVKPGATLHLTIPEHDILVQSLASELASSIEVISWNALWAGACDAVANDVSSLEGMTPYLKQHVSALPTQFK